MITDKLNCGIMSDLLPWYLDGKTSEETNILIREHLVECKACSQLMETMSAFPEEILVTDLPPKRKKRKKIGARIFFYGYVIIMLLLWLYMVLDMHSFFVWGW